MDAAGGDPVAVTDALVELSLAAAERDALSSPVFDVLPALAGAIGVARGASRRLCSTQPATSRTRTWQAGCGRYGFSVW
ncbi:hypothetical protein ACFQV2_24355 [Actinokineospora soli]|uniref:Uncharacterized protein n=1 Tax=Actinokineospora soli TaxID=1048753 RepID=A0ABW2TS19_9PSEU